MALFTHSVGVTYKTAAGSITNTTDSYTADGEVNISDVVAAGVSNYSFDVTFDPANVKSMVLYSDQAVTVKTNSSSSPQETISLAAKIQRVWTTDHTEVIPFSGAITKFYVSNAGTTDANFKFYCLVDLNP